MLTPHHVDWAQQAAEGVGRNAETLLELGDVLHQLVGTRDAGGRMVDALEEMEEQRR